MKKVAIIFLVIVGAFYFFCSNVFAQDISLKDFFIEEGIDSGEYVAVIDLGKNEFGEEKVLLVKVVWQEETKKIKKGIWGIYIKNPQKIPAYNGTVSKPLFSKKLMKVN